MININHGGSDTGPTGSDMGGPRKQQNGTGPAQGHAHDQFKRSPALPDSAPTFERGKGYFRHTPDAK